MMPNVLREVVQLNENIVRVTYGDTPDDADSILIDENFIQLKTQKNSFCEKSDSIDFIYKNKTVLTQTEVNLYEKDVCKYVIDGEPEMGKKMTANGEVTYVMNAASIPYRRSLGATVKFHIGADELLLGLGQYEDGIFNYRNRTEYLYESNMRIAMPILVTTGHYAIMIDSQSNMIFKSNKNEIEFDIDTTKRLRYYVILGRNTEDIVSQIQILTGGAAMLPRWSFGYIQSKERYKTEQELLETASCFHELDIPIDCIVQDWYSWKQGMWGDKTFDSVRYPDVPRLIRDLHDKNIRFMVSVWPNMSPDCEDYKEFHERNLLLDNSNVYNAFKEEAAALYWEQCFREIMSSGSDALWCDNAEPFSDADWFGEKKRTEEERYRLVTDESKKSIKWEELNAYGLYHARGIYRRWRESIPDKRVVNLIRSSYISGQKYGCITWSGDICATWNTLRKQITECLKMGLCANPYQTLDIGGFFVVNDKYENRGCEDHEHKPLWFWKGNYNDGVEDFGYRELYTRWLQFGTFLPIFRSHGTDTPREPWNFGHRGEVIYDTIVYFIRLRYQLMPYVYSMAAAAHRNAYIMMRSFVFDFPEDETAIRITNEYMFGPAFLVAPVLKPMYFDKNSEIIKNSDFKQSVYLPGNGLWYDFWNDDCYEGGQTVECEVTIQKLPLFVRAGSVIPLTDSLKYANDRDGYVSEILVYQGADGTFELYNDSGDGYEYLDKEYSCIRITYCDKNASLIISKVEGNYRIQKQFRVTYITKEGRRSTVVELHNDTATIEMSEM